MSKEYIEGFSELNDNLKNLGSLSTKKRVVRRALQKSFKHVADAGEANAPRRGGVNRLSKSMISGTRLNPTQARIEKKEDDGETVKTYIGSASTFYSSQVEYGTRHSAPEPYLGPAWESGKREGLDKVTTELTNEIGKSLRRVRK